MRVVVGQGSCGIATGAKKTAAEFERLIAENNLDVKVFSSDAIDFVQESGKGFFVGLEVLFAEDMERKIQKSDGNAAF